MACCSVFPNMQTMKTLVLNLRHAGFVGVARRRPTKHLMG